MSVFPSIKLKYFAHEGLAEAIRLTFFIGDVPFVDERLTEEQFAELKPSLPFGQVPVLDIDDGEVVVAQSQALLRYAGRLAKLFPVNNPLAALKIDEILNVLDELRIRMAASSSEEDEAKKKLMREELAQNIIPHYLNMLEPRFEQFKLSPGLHSDSKVFIHDIVVFLLLKHFRMGVLDYIPSNIADDFSLICAAFDKVDAHPKVKEWYALAHSCRPKLTLTYMDQAGRAEPIRLALFIGGVEFEDERISQEEFEIRKSLLPFHQLPVLQVDSEFLAQSFPILRYAGSVSGGGLYPANDPFFAVRVDEILSALDEFDNLYTQPLIREQDPAKKVELSRKLVDESIPEILRFLDKRVEASNGAFACGDTLTVADIAIFALVSFLSHPSGESDTPNTVMDPFDHLKRVYNQVTSHPKVAEWYETHTR